MLMIDNELKEQFYKNGYLLLEGFFSDEELSEVETLMESYVAQAEQKLEHQAKEKGNDFAQFETKVASFGEEASRELAFRKLGEHVKMDTLTKLLIGDGYEKEGLLVMITPKGNGQAWHRDCFDLNPDHFVVNRLIYTRDIRPEQGALIVVPGSHLLNTFPPGGLHESILGEVVISPKKGTVAFVHSSLFHRVNRNETGVPRCSINYRVRPKGTPAGLTKVGVYRTGKWNFAEGRKAEG
jgi:ectoine hydroxylase